MPAEHLNSACTCRACQLRDKGSRVEDLLLATATLLDWCERNPQTIEGLPSLVKRIDNLDRAFGRVHS